MNETENAKVTVVYDPDNGDEIAKELDCDHAPSLEAAASRDDVDCVIVATPELSAQRAGFVGGKTQKHVFCEKPIALSYQDCDEMVRACEQNGVIFMAGHIMNFFNGVHHAKELIQQG